VDRSLWTILTFAQLKLAVQNSTDYAKHGIRGTLAHRDVIVAIASDRLLTTSSTKKV